MPSDQQQLNDALKVQFEQYRQVCPSCQKPYKSYRGWANHIEREHGPVYKDLVRKIRRAGSRAE